MKSKDILKAFTGVKWSHYMQLLTAICILIKDNNCIIMSYFDVYHL